MANNKSLMTFRKMGGGECSVALFLILISILGWLETTTFDVDPGMVKTLGPAMFPRILFGGICIFSFLLIIQSLRDNTNRSDVVWGKWQKAPLAAGIMLFQALTFEELSAFISAGIALPLLLWVAAVKPKYIFLVTISFLLFIYLFFILLLRVPLPLEFLPTTLS